jgi:flagellar motor switch protein FliN/FliY
MNNDQATTLAEGIIKGALDVLSAMLSVSFSHQLREVQPASGADLAAHLERCPLVMRARVGSAGAIALLFPVGDASRFASMVLGEAPITKASLDDNDLNTLREVAEPCLGGAVTNLVERFGRSPEPPQDVEVAVFKPEDAPLLARFLGESATAVSFGFAASPDIDSEGVLLMSDAMQTMMDGAAPVSATAAPAPQISETAVSEILGAFGPPAESTEAPGFEAPGRAVLPNIDMVLDIRLVATARLGRIEMPIGDILALGPGSIIPVGHLVDEPVELLVNDKLIARGDVVVVDERFGLRITEIVSPKQRIESMH